jgi:hypothetical protein
MTEPMPGLTTKTMIEATTKPATPNQAQYTVTIQPVPPRDLVFRFFGPTLALAAANPSGWTSAFGTAQLYAYCLAAFGLWAAVPVVRRPVLASQHWHRLLARHRNTLFAAACALTAAAGRPPVWLMAADAALLLGYLLALDALAAGPIGIRQLRLGWPVGAAAGGTALVLALTQMPLTSSSGSLAASGRWLAGVGAGLAGLALALAFLPARREPSRAPSSESSDSRLRRLE